MRKASQLEGRLFKSLRHVTREGLQYCWSLPFAFVKIQLFRQVAIWSPSTGPKGSDTQRF